MTTLRGCDTEMTNTHRKRSILAGNTAQEVDSSTANSAGATVDRVAIFENKTSFLIQRALYLSSYE